MEEDLCGKLYTVVMKKLAGLSEMSRMESKAVERVIDDLFVQGPPLMAATPNVGEDVPFLSTEEIDCSSPKTVDSEVNLRYLKCGVNSRNLI